MDAPRKRLAITIAATVALTAAATAAPPPEPSEGKVWKTILSEDFDGDALDRDKWDPYYNWGGDGADYHHNYDGRVIEEYSIVEDGKLRLKCTKRSEDPYDHGNTYSVGVVSSKLKFKYGYFEGRFRIPHGYKDEYNGLWPAFWTTAAYEGWPGGGEIDVFEFFGSNKVWDAHVHWSDGGHQSSGFDHGVPDATTAFHTYGAHWQHGTIDFYLDDEYVQTITFPNFDHEHFIMINFGIHGPGDEHSWLGDASGNESNMPLYYECEFVRVWQEVDDDGTGASVPAAASATTPRLSVSTAGAAPRLVLDLDRAQTVTVELYDALGNLVSRQTKAGGSDRLEVTLPGRLAGMTGFCRVVGTDFTLTRRLFIAR
jgi:beta-glucanase (GH16 family)